MNKLNNKGFLLMLGLIGGLGAVLLALTGNPANMAFCIACFIRDSAGAMKFHSASVVQYFRPEIVGIIGGSFLISIATKEFKSTGGSSPVTRFLLGAIMMIGALIFLGCPLRMVIRMASGDISSYIGLIGFIGGVGTGSFMLKKGFSLGRSQETPKVNGYVLPGIVAGLFILFLAVPPLFAFSEKGPGSMHAPIYLSLGVGVLFGIIAQKTRMCFAGSVRDIFLLKNFNLLMVILGVFLPLLAYNIFTNKFAFVAYGPIAHAQTVWNIAGMFIVGFAAVLLGGCPLRQLVLAGTGSTDSAITVIGMFSGAALAHNFGLAAAAASAAKGEVAAVAGGPGINGQVAGVLCIIVLFFIAFTGLKKQRKGAN